MTDPAAIIAHCHENLGWSFTLLNGKRPMRPGWQSEQRLPLDDILEHLANGGNVGLRTGRVSKVVVIDLDPGATPPPLPETVEVATGRGRHLYYFYDAPLGNSNKAIKDRYGAHIDIRADGGQVVFPGSLHPETKQPYTFTRSPIDTILAPLPDWVTKPSVADTRKVGYAGTALKLEIEAVRRAANGERNNTLNTAAFSLGQLVGSGALSQSQVECELFAAAQEVGLGDIESRATIHSGMTSGMKHPRSAPLSRAPRVAGQEYVLCPGLHHTDQGEIIEQGVSSFATEVLSYLPEDLIYRRARIPGEIIGSPGKRKWIPLSTDRTRIMVDQNCTLRAWYKSREDDEQHLTFKYCIKDWGGIVLAASESHPGMRDIEYVTPYPIYFITDDGHWQLTPPGYQSGIYYDEPVDLLGIEPETDFETIHRTMFELVVDFPFLTNADRQNYYGLLLTPIIAPAVKGNRPLHIITAPIPRTGKSKLAEDVLGGILTGRKTPALQITGTDDERDKRITALLMQDETVVHLDNLPPKLDSPALASLLTASVYQSRLLGSSRIVSLPNNLVLVGTGNNVECSTEIAKRCVPIRLQPNTPNPERRVNFQYPNLWDHVSKSRRQILSCLLGMVQNWVEKNRPSGPSLGSIRLGGFESWSEAIGGILQVNGFHEWMENVNTWLQNSDSEGAEMTQFVNLWASKLGPHWVSGAQILECIKNTEVLERIFLSKSPNTALGKLLKNYDGAPVGDYVIYKRRTGTGFEYMLTINKKTSVGCVG